MYNEDETKRKYRNNYRKNIVFCGYNEEERNSIIVYDAKEVIFCDDAPYKKCPHIVYLDTIEEAFKHKGLELYLKVDKDTNLVEFDKKYRKKLDYWYITLYNPELKDQKKPKFSNVDMIEEQYMFGDYYSGWDWEIDRYFETHKPLKLHPRKKELLDKIHNYMKKHKEVPSKELVEEFKISIRNVQRYMKDINLLYNDIGYDYSKNLWYICR